MHPTNSSRPIQVLVDCSAFPSTWEATSAECQQFCQIWDLLRTQQLQGRITPKTWIQLKRSRNTPAVVLTYLEQVCGDRIPFKQWEKRGQIIIGIPPLSQPPTADHILVLTPQEFLTRVVPTPTSVTEQTVTGQEFLTHVLPGIIQQRVSLIPYTWKGWFTVGLLYLVYELILRKVNNQDFFLKGFKPRNSYPPERQAPVVVASPPTTSPSPNPNPDLQPDPQSTTSIESLPTHPALLSPDEADAGNNRHWQPQIPIPTLEDQEDQSPPVLRNSQPPGITPLPQASPFEKSINQPQPEGVKQESIPKQFEFQPPQIGKSQVVAILASNSFDNLREYRFTNKTTPQSPKANNPPNIEPPSGSQPPDNKADPANETPPTVKYSSGAYTINPSGQLRVNFLSDGGGYQGELAIVSLSGLETSQPDSAEFLREVVRRALSDSSLGHIVISDPKEGAQFSGTMPWESNLNSGPYLGTKTFSMQPGDQVALVLLTNGTFQNLSTTTIQNKDPRFLFSLVIDDPTNPQPDKQIADVTGQGRIFAMEDVRLSQQSDRDYNDLVFSIDGLLGGFTPKFDELINPGRDWRTSPIGQSITQPDNPQLLNDSNSQLTAALPPPGSGRFSLNDVDIANPLGRLANTPLDTQNIDPFGFQDPHPLF